MTTTPVTARIQRRKQNELLKHRGVDVVRFRRYGSHADHRSAQARLAELRAATITLATIAAKIGVTEGTLARVQRREDVSLRTVRALLAVNVSDFPNARRFTADELLWHVGTLRAQGYGMPWIETTAGITTNVLSLAVRRAGKGLIQHVSADMTTRLAATHAKWAYTPATVHNTGLEARQINRIKSIARASGWYPAAAYLDDGTLDWRSLPDHPWSVTDDWCHKQIEATKLIIDHPDLGSAALASLVLDGAATHGSPAHSALDKQFDRIMKRLGIRGNDDPTIAKERRAELTEAVWRFYNRGSETNPVAFVLDHDLASYSTREIARDHPDLLAHPIYEKIMEQRAEARKASRVRENKRMRNLRAQQRAAKADTVPEQVAA